MNHNVFVSHLQGPTLRIEVLVDPSIPNVPRFYNTEVGTIRTEFGFLTFNTTAPPTDMFKIPPACQEKMS